MKIWIKSTIAPEGKYLVVRRDGTIPHWPHFVLGADDPNCPAALRGYADAAEKNGEDEEYVASIRELASEWEQRPPGKADPSAPPHRKDNPAIIRLMRGEGDLSNNSYASVLLKQATGKIVVAIGNAVKCPHGHIHIYQPFDRLNGSIYCTEGECWSDGCQSDSGSGTSYTVSELSPV